MKTVINSARAAYFAGVGAVVATLAFAKDQFEPVHAAVAVAVGAGLSFFHAVASSVSPLYQAAASKLRAKLADLADTFGH